MSEMTPSKAKYVGILIPIRSGTIDKVKLFLNPWLLNMMKINSSFFFFWLLSGEQTKQDRWVFGLEKWHVYHPYLAGLNKVHVTSIVRVERILPVLIARNRI